MPHPQLSFEIPANPCFSDDILVAGKVGLSESTDQPSRSYGTEYGEDHDRPEGKGGIDDRDCTVIRRSGEVRVDGDPDETEQDGYTQNDPGDKGPISRVDSDVQVGRDYPCRSDGSTKVPKRIGVHPIVRPSRASAVCQEWDEKDDTRLVETIRHVYPETPSSIFQALNTAFVQRGKSHASFGVGVLVEHAENRNGHRRKDQIIQQDKGVFEQVSRIERVVDEEPEHG